MPPARVKAMCSENHGGETASATRAVWRTRSASSPSALPSESPMPCRSTGTASRIRTRSRIPAGPATSSGLHSTAPNSPRWRMTSHRQASRKLTPAPRNGSSATAPSATAAAASPAAATAAVAAAAARLGRRDQGLLERGEGRQDLDAEDPRHQGQLALARAPAGGDHLHQALMRLPEPAQIPLSRGRLSGRLHQGDRRQRGADHEEDQELDVAPAPRHGHQQLDEAEPGDRQERREPEETVDRPLAGAGRQPLGLELLAQPRQPGLERLD